MGTKILILSVYFFLKKAKSLQKKKNMPIISLITISISVARANLDLWLNPCLPGTNTEEERAISTLFISGLIGFPVLVALLTVLLKNKPRLQSGLLYTGAGGIMLLALGMLAYWLYSGAPRWNLFVDTKLLDHIMLFGELCFLGIISYFGIRYRKPLVIVLEALQTLLLVYVELFVPVEENTHIRIDSLAMLMCLIIAIVGGFIVIYSVGYMKIYHAHHKDVKDRRSLFLALLFVFLGAMMGLVLASNLVWMYFFWEITSLISFLLIGYTKSQEAIKNSFTALWMNLLGGLGFALAVAISAVKYKTVQLSDIVEIGAVIPVALLAFAGLTKSAQMPFSRWLLGAMVAPTPSSALLHSATMVKAGVYLLIRLSPALHGSLAGTMVAFVGAFTFLSASMMAISQSDGKKVLAFSTISNLGLICACAGVGVEATVWGAIMLTIFHSVSKSMLFQAVGSVENSLGTRDIEHMHGLVLRLPYLTYIMGIGIAGMYLAPFGMLISKWVTLKAFVDDGDYLLVMFLAFGSATTMLYWTKWLTKLIALHHTNEKVEDVTKKGQYTSMWTHAGVMLGLCLAYPALSLNVINPLVKELFGSSHEVLSPNILLTMVIMLVSVLIIPAAMFLVTRTTHQHFVPTYMSGANVGDNTYFTNSEGEAEHLYLTNWYMRDSFGPDRLMRISSLLAACFIAVMLMLMLGGAL